MTDQELARAAAAGDHAAFHQIYQDNADRVLRLVTRILGPVPGRDDLVQEVFVELHHALPSFRSEARLSTFVYRIAVRVTLKSARRWRKQQLTFDERKLDDCVEPGRSPAEHADDRQALARALAVIATLKPARRIAFLLVAVEGLSYEEAGHVLDISADAAKQRTLRARRDVKRALARQERQRRRP